MYKFMQVTIHRRRRRTRLITILRFGRAIIRVQLIRRASSFHFIILELNKKVKKKKNKSGKRSRLFHSDVSFFCDERLMDYSKFVHRVIIIVVGCNLVAELFKGGNLYS